MKIGVSSACLYPMETIASIRTLTECGVDFFEIFFNTISEIEQGYVDEIKKLLNSADANVCSIHPFTSGYEPYLLFTDYERRYRDTLEFYKKYFYCAARLGAKIIVIHGDRKTAANGISDEEYFEKFAELSKIANEYGVTLAQENVNAFRSQRPEFVRKMREYLGGASSFVFDIKQAVRSGTDPYEMCSAMGDRLVHIHLNDNSPDSDCLLPGSGSMDYEKLLNLLNRIGYQGDIVIEVYRRSFGDISELKASYEYVKKLCENYFVKINKKTI